MAQKLITLLSLIVMLAAYPSALLSQTSSRVDLKRISKEWIKTCGELDAGAAAVGNRKVCYTTADFSDKPDGAPVLAIAVYETEGSNEFTLRLLMPVGLLQKPGILWKINSRKSVQGFFEICFPNGCFAEIKMTKENLNELLKSSTLTISVKNQSNAVVDFVSPINGLRQAFSGSAQTIASAGPSASDTSVKKPVAVQPAQNAQERLSPNPSQMQPSVQPERIEPATASQGRRVALIIGNTRYRHTARLENPTNDADLIASSLRNVGFQSVIVKKDLTREETLRALRDFRELADAADWAIVHYAGHGVEFGGVNYLVPIEAQLRSDRDIELEAITVSTVLSAIEGARKLRLVVLDACRDNPFAGQMRRTIASRSLGRGLAQMEPQAGTLIAYAAKHGEVADDGAGSKNSPFATALAKRLQQSPPLEVRRLFDFVRDDVMEMTRNKQQPFTYGSLTAREDFFFATR